MTKRPTVISLFTGAGGLDYGLEAAGFDVSAALEIDNDCCKTLAQNRDWHVVQRSILEITADELLTEAALRPKEVDLLAGGPPCQPFSKAGRWKSGDTLRLKDPRAKTIRAFMEMVEGVLPRVVLLENVAGLAFVEKDEALKLILRMFQEINERCGTSYLPTYSVLNAADFGVPQIRERFFLVASRDGLKFRFPPRTHAPADDAEVIAGNLETYRTAWDALRGYRDVRSRSLEPTGKWAALLPTIPEGKNYLWHTERGGGVPLFGWRRRYWSFLLKLSKNAPSWTIQAQPGPACGPFHWKNRRLSTAELCRLQTFPRGLSITGARLSQQRQIGNAVPSLLGELLGLEIRRQLLGQNVRRKLTLMPAATNRIPAPEPVSRQIPPQYAKYIGSQRAHPGAGKGPGARAHRRQQLA